MQNKAALWTRNFIFSECHKFPIGSDLLSLGCGDRRLCRSRTWRQLPQAGLVFGLIYCRQPSSGRLLVGKFLEALWTKNNFNCWSDWILDFFWFLLYPVWRRHAAFVRLCMAL